MSDKIENIALRPKNEVDEERRSFLRKSAYAAYATPLITALLVEEAAAGWSGCPPAKKAKCAAGMLPPAACRRC